MKSYRLLPALILFSLTSCVYHKTVIPAADAPTPPTQVNENKPKTDKNQQPQNGLPVQPTIDPNYIKKK
jgi:hypothetical protein